MESMESIWRQNVRLPIRIDKKVKQILKEQTYSQISSELVVYNSRQHV